MTNDQPTVDPRFDPIFQRGYEGGLQDAGTSVPAPEPVAAAPVDPAPEPEPAPSPTVPQPHTGVAAAMSSQPIVTVEYPGGEPEPPARILNPFIILLWVIGVALVLIGASASYESFSRSMGSMSRPEDMAFQQLIWMLSPGVVTVGLGIMAGLLFWHAAAWRRSRA